MRSGVIVNKGDYEKLADFRYELRRFLRFSENVCSANGITALQYQLLLQLRGFPGRDWAFVGELAERLQSQPHGVVALISRCEMGGWVERRSDPRDRRRVRIHLTSAGRRCVGQLAAMHKGELQKLLDALQAVHRPANVSRTP